MQSDARTERPDVVPAHARFCARARSYVDHVSHSSAITQHSADPMRTQHSSGFGNELEKDIHLHVSCRENNGHTRPLRGARDSPPRIVRWQLFVLIVRKREFAAQIFAVAKVLAHHVQLR